MDGVCWAVEPKTCLSGKEGCLPWRRCAGEACSPRARKCSLLLWDAASLTLCRVGQRIWRLWKALHAKRSLRSVDLILHLLRRHWPCPGRWSQDTIGHFVQMSSGALWPAELGTQGPAWPALGPAPVLRESTPPWTSLPISSWASTVPTVGNSHQTISPVHLLYLLPGPALRPSSGKPCPISQGGHLSLPQPTLSPGWSLGTSPLWLFTGHGWMAGAVSGGPPASLTTHRLLGCKCQMHAAST